MCTFKRNSDTSQKTGFNRNFVKKKCVHVYAIVCMHVFIYTEINRGEILHANININGGIFLPFKNFINYLVVAVNPGFINIFLLMIHLELEQLRMHPRWVFTSGLVPIIAQLLPLI